MGRKGEGRGGGFVFFEQLIALSSYIKQNLEILTASSYAIKQTS